MKSILIFILCVSAHLSSAQKKTMLFEGTAIKGWHNFKKSIVDSWTIEDGALTTDGKGSDLVSDKEYGDFVLDFDFKVQPKGNSGVIYKVIEVNDEAHFATYASGPEFQIIDDIAYPEELKDVQKSGANYDINPPKMIASHPAGEWNHGTIKVKNNKITHSINGKKVVKYTYGDATWDAGVVKSKFAKWPYAMAHHKGKIALQGHGDRIYFKNIAIKEL
ncbi:MAG: DUF1080 domain-containing protein [Saprospiraceae bacterium]|nr:DUF1080 domain-containing protein [Saprospiraceae bacterium]MBK6476749.1 DUF1080 domain-containing protein [Saprospiraceae bacterium]MBK9930500.1 DUF1080 domain-containing protein [Saprospiraceae bacterium]